MFIHIHHEEVTQLPMDHNEWWSVYHQTCAVTTCCWRDKGINRLQSI